VDLLGACRFSCGLQRVLPAKTTLTYDLSGRILAVTNELSHATTYSYDAPQWAMSILPYCGSHGDSKRLTPFERRELMRLVLCRAEVGDRADRFGAVRDPAFNNGDGPEPFTL